MGAEARLEDLLKPEQAAARLRVCTKTLGRLRRAGLIRYVAVTERKIMYRAQDCDNFIEAQVRQDEPQAPKRRVGKPRVARTGNVVPITRYVPRSAQR